MAQHMLGQLPLPAGMLWVDEFGWRPVEATREYSVTGAQIIDVAEREGGRPITLQATEDHGWMTRENLLALQELAADADGTFTLTLADGRAFEVMFAPDTDPVTARPLARPEIPSASWPYITTLRLIEV